MNHERILLTLYDMALAIGGEVRLAPLLTHTLQRLLHHTAFPCGFVLLAEPTAVGVGVPGRVVLAQAIGDHRLAREVGHTFDVPATLLETTATVLPVDDAFFCLPLSADRYATALRLPIPGLGVILLLSPEARPEDRDFTEILTPVLSNLANAIRLCRLNEAYTDELIADRDRARSELVRFRSALDTTDDAVFLIDPVSMRFIDFNRGARQALGYDDAELREMGPQDVKPEFSAAELQARFRQVRSGDDAEAELTTIHRRRDGSLYPVELRLSVLEMADDRWLVIALARDITERREAEAALDQARSRALVTLHSIGDAVISTDRFGYVDYLNPSAERLTGWNNAEAHGRHADEVCMLVNEASGQPARSPVTTVLGERRIVGQSNHLLLTRDGQEVAIEGSAAPIRDRAGVIIGVVVVLHDVSRTREMADRLTWQATHDALTGLSNRSEFERLLSGALDAARNRGDDYTVLYIDLDQFKVVNDTCGHGAGDEMLRQLSTALRQEVRERDALARLGGDEFGLLLENCPLPKAEEIAEKLLARINDFRFAWEDRSFAVGASIGIALLDGLSESTAAVLSAADMACYVAKDAGRNRYHFYTPDDQELVRRRGEMQLVSEISAALEEGRFELYAQPIVPTGNHGAVHREILLRMHTGDGKLLGPGAFIPAAERYNLMPAIDRWVIERLLSGHADHIREQHRRLQGTSGYVFAINLSGASLGDPELLSFVLGRIQRYRIPPSALCFEITETAAIANLSRASKVIRELRGHGCRFSLDDFGSGLSSFGYLKNLPVDYLKIDGSFVKDMIDDPIDLAMVEAINHIGHVMGIGTIAEFVESVEIFERLRALGVDYAQGYAVGRPEPLGDPGAEEEIPAAAGSAEG